MADVDVWMAFVASWRANDQVVFAVGSWLVHMICFWGLNGFLFMCYKYNWFRRNRIERQPFSHRIDFPSSDLVREALWNNVINHFIVHPLVMWYVYDVFYYFGMRVSAPLPYFTEVVRDFAAAIAINDTIFYWFHRGLHNPLVYKYIHKKHHRFNYSIGIAAEYAHPLEDLLCNVIPTFAGCLLMGSHVTTLWLWLALRLLETIDTHSGYSFDWSPTKWLPFLNGSVRHDFHHSHNTGCYGAMTPFWDYLMGTDATYHEFVKDREHFIANGNLTNKLD